MNEQVIERVRALCRVAEDLAEVMTDREREVFADALESIEIFGEGCLFTDRHVERLAELARLIRNRAKVKASRLAAIAE